jgi:malate dehydrogenase
MKIGIIGGAGTLGATSAFVMAGQQLASEICLIDIKQNVAKSHEMDMGQAVASLSSTQITSGGFDQLAGADLVLITVGIPEGQVSSRMDYLTGNLKIMTSVCEQIERYAPNALIMTATNPLDVLNSLMPSLMPIRPERLIGFSLNDSYRLRWAVSKVMAVDINEVDAMVLGEHGEDQCPLFSRIFVRGERLAMLPEQEAQVQKLIRNWFTEYQGLNSGRTSGWLSAINIARVVRAIVHDTHEVLPCSVIGADGISIGQAVRLGRNGVEQIVEIEMNESEETMFQTAHKKIGRIAAEVRGAYHT